MNRLEAAAREAFAAYRAIFPGPEITCWNACDRIAFAELKAALDELPPRPAAPAQSARAVGEASEHIASPRHQEAS